MKNLGIIILISSIAGVYIANIAGLPIGIIAFIASIFSYSIFDDQKDDGKAPLLITIIVFWTLALKRFIESKDLAMVFFAIPLTVIFIYVQLKINKKSQNDSKQIETVPSKYDNDLEENLKRFNRINMILSSIMLLLALSTFILIPYNNFDISFLYIILQFILVIIIFTAMYNGGIRKETEPKEATKNIIRTATAISALQGNLGAINAENNYEENKGIYPRRWSTIGFYVLLIFLLPFIIPVIYFLIKGEIVISDTKVMILFAIDCIIFVMMYIISFIPFTIAGYLKEKIIKKIRFSLKSWFKLNIITSLIFIFIGTGLGINIILQTNNDNTLSSKYKERLSSIQRSKIKIKGSDLSLEFENQDYSYMEKIIKEELGKKAFYKIIKEDDVKEDASGEKYISITYAAHEENQEDIICFIFRKYLTESNYHDLGEIELYLMWKSESITKEKLH